MRALYRVRNDLSVPFCGIFSPLLQFSPTAVCGEAAGYRGRETFGRGIISWAHLLFKEGGEVFPCEV